MLNKLNIQRNIIYLYLLMKKSERKRKILNRIILFLIIFLYDCISGGEISFENYYIVK